MIRDKYVESPHTTDFAIMFLPTEGLFAEVLRRPGLADHLHRECRTVIAGPTTLFAMLNSLQMGFRTLALERRSAEVWQVLGAVKTEFSKFGEVLATSAPPAADCVGHDRLGAAPIDSDEQGAEIRRSAAARRGRATSANRARDT